MKYIIAGHSSFYPRENWLNKIFSKIFQGNINEKVNHSFFSRNKITDAIDILGVGSAMVESIKFWGDFFEIVNIDKISKTLSLSPSGKIIFSKDPYFQNPNSLWILHCNSLCKNSESPLIWTLALENKYSNIFTRETLEERCKIFVQENSIKASEKTLKDTVSVFIKTFLYDFSENKDPEDNIISPFSSLKYLTCKNNDNFYFRNISSGEISEYILLYILYKKLDFFNKNNKILLDELFSLTNNIIKINHTEFIKLIKKLEDCGEITIDRSANLENIIFKNNEITEEFILNKILESESIING